jgi:hypothetical protein
VSLRIPEILGYALAGVIESGMFVHIPKFRNGAGKILANASTSLLGLLRANIRIFPAPRIKFWDMLSAMKMPPYRRGTPIFKAWRVSSMLP